MTKEIAKNKKNKGIDMEYAKILLYDLVIDTFVEYLQNEKKTEFECSSNLCDIAVRCL